MNEKDYKRNVTLGIICDILSLFILGMIFAGISYILFDKNYKGSLDSRKKRNSSIWGKTIAVFLFFESSSYHGQTNTTSINEKMAVAIAVGLIFAVIGYFIMKSKDKKNPLSENKEKESYFKCDNCGSRVKEKATKCPNCGAEFIDDELEENYKVQFKCDNCGTLVKESDTKCPKCGESFDDSEDEQINIKDKKEDSKSDMDKKYSDLRKLKELLDDDIISKEEFEKEKKKILNKKI